MTTFVLECVSKETGDIKIFKYDNMTSELLTENDYPVQIPDSIVRYKESKNIINPSYKSEAMPTKTNDISVLKIQLGLSCNYSCDYCSQRFVPHADSTNPSDVKPFVDGMSEWFAGGEDGLGLGAKVEFWGGEPFVYWKTFKPLAESIRNKYPNIRMSTITNGSLLDKEKVDWLDANGFSVGFSHDGPGQSVRGIDPFDVPEQAEAIRYLFEVLQPKGRVSVNAMLHMNNSSRVEIQEWLRSRLNDNITIGEGSLIDAYDEGGLGRSATTLEEASLYARNAFNEVRNDDIVSFDYPIQQVKSMILSIVNRTAGESLGQKCGMDRSDRVAVDLHGNVLTCQNTSAAAISGNGKSHRLGNVLELEKVTPNTAQHWSTRSDCSSCPVLHLCRGSCMFLQGDLWDASCLHSFIDNWVFFAIAIEELTGYIPTRVIGGRKDRETPFNMVSSPKKKVIQIVRV